MRSALLILFLISRFVTTAQELLSIDSLKKKIDSVRNFVYRFPSDDLLPPEFISSSLENQYYGQSEGKTPGYYRGHVFLLTLRSNCTVIYETFYQRYSYARIEFHIGKYRVSGDTLHLTYQSLLPGKPGEIYVSPTIPVSWILPDLPEYLLIDKTSLVEPFEQRLKKGAFYSLSDKSQFDPRGCK
jgi:hypothetical protein